MNKKNRRNAYRHRNQPMDGNKIRVRGKRLDEVDETKLTLAYWLLAKRLVEDRTDGGPIKEEDVRGLAGDLDAGTEGEARS